MNAIGLVYCIGAVITFIALIANRVYARGDMDWDGYGFEAFLTYLCFAVVWPALIPYWTGVWIGWFVRWVAK